MQPVTKLKYYGIIQSILVILLGLTQWFLQGVGVGFVCVVLALAQLGVLVWLVVSIIQPLARFEKRLDEDVAEDAMGKNLFEEGKAETPYIDTLNQMIDVFATQKIRDNYAEMFDKQAELTALQSQINPHFLYNTLESIRAQTLLDGNKEVAKMVEALASFFRYSISRKGSLVTLRDELANIKNYMTIQRYRFNNRFTLDIYLDEQDEVAYDYYIPRLIIQPVVENAIYHGLEEVLVGGKVTIEIIVTESNLIITISDNGKGMDGATLHNLNAKIHSDDKFLKPDEENQSGGMGIALPNIHKRIQLLFGQRYGVSVYSTVAQGTDVEITIPAAQGRDT